jgi:hypothetical protein
MKMSVAVVVAWLVGASSAVAQVAPVVPDPDPAKPQVQTFEMLLRSAVETGGQNFARRAAQITPDIAELSFSTGEAPVVSGIADHQLGLYVFQVQVPSVSLLSLQVMNLMMNRPALGRPVGRVAATNVPDGPPAAVALPDFVGMYRIAVRDALIDAIVDSDTLLVYASAIEPPMQPSLLRQPSNKLVLKATGADVLEYRQGKITRDEIRRRIRVASF